MLGRGLFPANNIIMSVTSPQDDSFELFDLRVEVVCPVGERILCGAKEGDHFTLQGEMLYLPPGQGFSIYSLCKFITISTIVAHLFQSPHSKLLFYHS